MSPVATKKTNVSVTASTLAEIGLVASPANLDLSALLEARRQRPDQHLAYEEAEAYVDELLPSEEDSTLLEEHLWKCAFCRGIVADQMQSTDGSTQRPRQFLDRVERYRVLTAVADATAAAVRERHHRAGVSLAYKRDGIFVEELPDGSIRPLTAEADRGSGPSEGHGA